MLLLNAGARSTARRAGALSTAVLTLVSVWPADAISSAQEVPFSVRPPPPGTPMPPPVDRTADRLAGSEWLIGMPADRVTAALAKGLKVKELNPATSYRDGAIEVVTDRCYVLIETSRMMMDELGTVLRREAVVSHVAGVKLDWSALSEAEALACSDIIRPSYGKRGQQYP